ncbi:MAG: choice-of-anchor D domain-containing protein, partial [Gemmatimonadota bacterium]
FAEVAAAAGVADPQSGRGVAWADFDADGDADAYVALSGVANLLYQNQGGGTFTEVGAIAGVNDAGTAEGLAWGDYDNDGQLDLYVAEAGPNLLYHNEGDQTFTEVAAAATPLLASLPVSETTAPPPPPPDPPAPPPPPPPEPPPPPPPPPPPEPPPSPAPEPGIVYWVDLQVAPDTLDFGRVRIGETAILACIAANPGNAELQVSSVRFDNGLFTVEDNSFTLPPGGSREVAVTFTALRLQAEVGLGSFYSRAPETRLLVVRGVGVEPPRLTVSASQVDLGRAVVGRSMMACLSLANTGGDTLHLHRIETSGPDFAAQLTAACLAPGQELELSLAFTPSRPGPVAAALLLAGDGEDARAEVSLTGTGLDPLDLDRDGRVCPADLLLMTQAINTGQPLEGVCLDLNGDGAINQADVATLAASAPTLAGSTALATADSEGVVCLPTVTGSGDATMVTRPPAHGVLEITDAGITYTAERGFDGLDFFCLCPDGDQPEVVLTFVVRAARPANRDPVLEPVGDLVVAVGETLVIDLQATDPDGDAIELTAVGLPGAELAGSRLTWTPGPGDVGQHLVAVRARDEYGTGVSTTIQLQVTGPPVAAASDTAATSSAPSGEVVADTADPGDVEFADGAGSEGLDTVGVTGADTTAAPAPLEADAGEIAADQSRPGDAAAADPGPAAGQTGDDGAIAVDIGTTAGEGSASGGAPDQDMEGVAAGPAPPTGAAGDPSPVGDAATTATDTGDREGAAPPEEGADQPDSPLSGADSGAAPVTATAPPAEDDQPLSSQGSPDSGPAPEPDPTTAPPAEDDQPLSSQGSPDSGPAPEPDPTTAPPAEDDQPLSSQGSPDSGPA